MKHKKLLAKVDESIKAAEFEERWMWTTNAKALRAVVQWHRPLGKYCQRCSVNDWGQEAQKYPCETIQAIEKELK